MSSAVNDVPPTPPVEKIYPSVVELTTTINFIKCGEPECYRVFMSTSNYVMHLQKTHHIHQPKNKSVKQFFCPIPQCIHSKDKNHFNKMKFLKQHYLKIHAERNYICEKCNKGFPSERLKRKHITVCGVVYQCPECNYKYSSKEGLTTHNRRKHNFLPVMPKPIQAVQIIPVFIQINNDIKEPKRVDIAIQTSPPPSTKNSKSHVKRKSTQQTQTCVKKKSKISAETQTTGDCILRRAILDANIKEIEIPNSKKCSSETQTRAKPQDTSINMIPNDLDFSNINSNMLFQSSSCQTNFGPYDTRCSETQTLIPSPSFDNDIANLMENNSPNMLLQAPDPFQIIKKTSETQTLIHTPGFDVIANLTENNSPNILLQSSDHYQSPKTQTLISSPSFVNIANLTEDNSANILLQSSSSQTNVDHLNIFEDSPFGNCNNSETQTDLIYNDEFFQSTVLSSHIETQTNEELENYINMYTQTSDELLLSDLEFTDIQTQTNWPDYEMFVSTETQTLSSNINNNNNNNNTATTDKTLFELGLNRDTSHTETQTDMEYKLMLEEINA